MEFNLPTTKGEMYAILNDLFYYYRIRREGYEEINLQPLNLTRMEYQPATDEELKVKAEKLVAAQKSRELSDYKSKLSREITVLAEKITLAESNAVREVEAVEKLYADSIEAVLKKATVAGIYSSSIMVDKTAQLEDSKNKSIQEITSKNNENIASLTAQKTALEYELSAAEDYFKSSHEADTDKKLTELIDEREKTVREVFEYNNALDEKEQRYINTIKQTNASLKLRFLDISTGHFTKDQLVDMGYYEDVIRCVCGYFDRLDPSAAFQDIGSEKKLAVYLDDYYQDLVYMYSLLG